jgi:hypothetical protein
MLDYATFCFGVFVVCVFFVGWYAKQALDDIKAEQKEKEEAEYVRQREEKLEDAHRRWDASMEAVKELWI